MQTQTVNQLSEEAIVATQRMYGDAQQSIKALEWLTEQGFEPETFIVGRAKKPVIEIKPSPLCFHVLIRDKGFNTYCYIRRFGKHGLEYVLRATVFGCYVQWIETRY